MKDNTKKPNSRKPASEGAKVSKRQIDVKETGKKKSGWRTVGKWVLWILTVMTLTGLLAACFGGNFNPASFKGSSLFILTLPVWLLLWFIVTALDALWCRKAMVFCILTFIVCANAIWDYFPLNLGGPSEKKYAECPKFTLLSYNVLSFKDHTEEYANGINQTLSYIIRTNADVVCLQEVEVTLTHPFKPYHITREQIDTISGMYPYRLLYGGFLAVLSKYPVEAIHTPPLSDDPRYKWAAYPIGVFRLNIEGTPVTLFDVHLQSYGLSASDKALYKNITDGKEIAEAAEGSVRQTLREIKHQIYHKVQLSAVKRAREADTLCRYIEKFGGPNVIVSGDFNDVPGCYTIRQLEDHDLHQVYPKLGFGPMITFNADKFYFRIDHVMYRGNLVPLKMTRGSIKTSDHYPILTTFAIISDNK